MSQVGGVSHLYPPTAKIKELSVKIKVDYDWMKQSANTCGPFIFYKDDAGVIRNLEARW